MTNTFGVNFTTFVEKWRRQHIAFIVQIGIATIFDLATSHVVKLSCDYNENNTYLSKTDIVRLKK